MAEGNGATPTDAQKAAGAIASVSSQQLVSLSRQQLKTLATIVQRLDLAKQLGMSYDGNRDTYKVFGYPQLLTFQQMWGKYRRQDIARRIVNAPVKATWRGKPKVDGGQEFNTAWEQLVKATNFWAKVERLDRLASIGTFAVLVMGYSDANDPSQPIQPKPYSASGRKLLYVSPFAEMALKIDNWEQDTKNPRFGMPTGYQVSLVNQAQLATAVVSTQTVGQIPNRQAQIGETKLWHWSRCLHVAEDLLMDDVFGASRMESVYNLLDDLAKIDRKSVV